MNTLTALSGLVDVVVMRLVRNAMVVAVLSAASLLTGCGGDDGPGTNPPPVEDENILRFTTDSYSVEAGEEVNYLCWTTRVPEDKDIFVTRVTPTYGLATHHLGVYSTLSDEPEGTFVCPELVREDWVPLYGGGVESGTLQAPPGTGFELKAGQQILVQLHLLNASTEPVEDVAVIELETTDEDVIPAGMYGMDNRSLAIAPQSTDQMAEMSCIVPWDMDVFAVFGHMHTFGTRIEFSRGDQPGGELLHEQSWDFDDQPTVGTSFSLKSGENIHLRCFYDNTSDVELNYGDSTFDEMCSFALYYSPYDTLFGCVQ